MSNQQKIRVGWLNIIEKHSSNPRTKDSLCPSLEDFVLSRTLTKCGPKNAPLIGGLCQAADFDQMWSEMIEKHSSNPRRKDSLCSSSEDFVSSWTLTKCGPKNAALIGGHLPRSGLWPNVVRNVPLIGGLCLIPDFDQMWPDNAPLVGGLCHAADFWPNLVNNAPLFGGLCRIPDVFDKQQLINKHTSRNKQSIWLSWAAERLFVCWEASYDSSIDKKMTQLVSMQTYRPLTWIVHANHNQTVQHCITM